MGTKLTILRDKELEELKMLGEKLKKGNRTEQELGNRIFKFTEGRRPIFSSDKKNIIDREIDNEVGREMFPDKEAADEALAH